MKLLRLLVLLLPVLCGAYRPLPGTLYAFPRPPALEPAIQFWKDVFGRWNEDQIVFFDGRDLSRIYEIRRLPPADGTRLRERERESLRARWKQELQDDLEALGRGGVDYDALTGRPYRLFALWDESRDRGVYRAAADNIRSQRGTREQFAEGVARSTRYLDAFRKILREEGVPEELVFLPHVESSYRWNARSSVGALGMWQFMATTARKYIVVDQAVDERLDPFSAAHAAARYLKNAREELGTWPLAITSYNHGVDGIRSAVLATGTRDIAAIIARYDGPLFGFHGRNFYPEFLAAKEVAEDLVANPEGLDLDPPAAYDTFTLPAYVKVPRLLSAFALNAETLRAMNPSITPHAWSGDLHLTKGMNLKLPPGTGLRAPVAFADIPATDRPTERPERTYRVQRGDSLGIIAARHRTTVNALQRLNGIRNPNLLRVGTLLRLPG
jgi:membrane-bound lytic murein transglycosylase D